MLVHLTTVLYQKKAVIVVEARRPFVRLEKGSLLQIVFLRAFHNAPSVTCRASDVKSKHNEKGSDQHLRKNVSKSAPIKPGPMVTDDVSAVALGQRRNPLVHLPVPRFSKTCPPRPRNANAVCLKYIAHLCIPAGIGKEESIKSLSSPSLIHLPVAVPSGGCQMQIA